jgi:hypothetical protein
MGAHVSSPVPRIEKWQNTAGWRGAADVAMLERVSSVSIDEDQTLLVRTG